MSSMVKLNIKPIILANINLILIMTNISSLPSTCGMLSAMTFVAQLAELHTIDSQGL